MTLLFVYNANNDLKSELLGYIHKVLRPSTYECDLCALTYHNLGQRRDWKAFKERTDAALSFYYIKGFEEEFNESHVYPVIIERIQDENNIVLNRKELSDIDSVKELIVKLEMYINKA